MCAANPSVIVVFVCVIGLWSINVAVGKAVRAGGDLDRQIAVLVVGKGVRIDLHMSVYYLQSYIVISLFR